MAAKLHQAVKATILHLMPSAFIVYVLGLSNFAQAISLDPNSLFLPAVTTYELGFKLQNMGPGLQGAASFPTCLLVPACAGDSIS